MSYNASQSDPPGRPSAAPEPYKAENVLPSVAAPTGTFVLQLFVIPLIIVGLIFGVWLTFSWLAHAGTSPEEIVADLDKLNDDSWRKALTLANILHNPEYDELKSDHSLAQRLATMLETQVREGQQDAEHIKLRMFLCRALGEFQVLDGLPALMLAAKTERPPSAASEESDPNVERPPTDLDVRRSAIEALAALAKNVDDKTDLPELRKNSELLTLLDNAAHEHTDNPAEKLPREQLRSTATFALGVLGGPAALELVHGRLNDAAPNVRYNAATGLARHGDARALPALLEMIDPHNEDVVADETDENAQAWKRALVASNGMRALEQLLSLNKEIDRARVQAALEKLKADLPAERVYDKVRADATEMLARMKKGEG